MGAGQRQRGNEAALITRDRMRVDVKAEFYVRVKPTKEAIADAAQTLGKRTMNPQALKELVEGKFVDALRAVAAGMAMEELHENRVDFVQKVQAAVMEDLLKNGLELEAVSLTALDQTDQSFFNPRNAFDAQGLTKLTEEIEERKKQRNDIERDTDVLIKTKNLQTEKQKLEISRDEEYARMMQEREVEVRKANEATTTAEEQAAKQRQAREAQITAKKIVDQAQIVAERAVEEERIDKDRLLKEKDIARERSIEEAEILRRKTVELSDQDRAIAIAEKSKEKSQSEAEADQARALAVRAQEQVVTSRETEVAEREKAIELVEAAKKAERDAIGITVAAKADKEAADDKAEAVRTLATGDADKVKIAAAADANSEIVRADAAARRYTVDADGSRALHEAENILDPAIIAMRVKLSIIDNLDKIIAESVKPMEQIDDIKIIQVDGLTGNGHGASGGVGAAANDGGGSSGNLADQVVNSALRYRSQAPLVDAILKEVGMTGSDLEGLTAALHGGEQAAKSGETKPIAPGDAPKPAG